MKHIKDSIELLNLIEDSEKKERRLPMAVTAKEIPKERGIFNSIWELFKKYYNEPNTDETWEQFIDESQELVRKYDNHPLAVKLSVAILVTKEDVEKMKEKGINT